MKSEKSRRPNVAVRAIIANAEGKVLILKRADTKHGNGKWCLPGGNVEYGQTINEAVLKEIMQETSLTCKEVDFLFYLENLPSEASEPHYINLAFRCTAEGIVKLNHESSDYSWIDSTDIINYLIAFRNDEILSRYWGLNA
jgi:8-oxo-dGTP pyrophosphatase MutT (NUDIX family)